MKLFSYIIRNKERKVVKGVIPFESEDALKKHFRNQGYLVLSINETSTNENNSKTSPPTFEGSNLFKTLFIFLGIGLFIFALLKLPLGSLIKEDFPERKATSKPKTTSTKTKKSPLPEKSSLKIPETPETAETLRPTEEKAIAYTQGETTVIKIRGAETAPESPTLISSSTKAYQHYSKARYYCPKKTTKAIRRCKENCRLAIREAQSALYSAEGNEARLKAIIRECRDMQR